MIYAENILLCIAAPLLLSLLFVHGPVRRYVLAFVAGMIACLLAAYVTGFLRLLISWEETDVRIFLSPVVEELIKLLPLLILLLLSEQKDDGLRRRWEPGLPPLRTAAVCSAPGPSACPSSSSAGWR